MNQDELFNYMVLHQRKSVNPEFKLNFKDIRRIIKHTNGCSIFNKTCCQWDGYVTYNKTYYINFYLHGRKIALHRILYINFINNLFENNYLTFKCNNKGSCISLNCICIKKLKKSNNISVTPNKGNKKKLIIVSFF